MMMLLWILETMGAILCGDVEWIVNRRGKG
jgi:hypothetical protein